MSVVHGPSRKVPKHRRQPARSIQTLNVDFIKAEVVNYQDLLDNGSLAAAKEKGIVGMEGKEYVVKDGDVILFRFNV